MTTAPDRHRGFTLMEMVLTLTVLAVLATVAAPYLSNGVTAYNDTAGALETVGKLRVVSERLVREIREIGRDGGGNFAITVPLSGTNLQFIKLDGEQVTVSEVAPLAHLAYASVAGTPTLVDEVTSLTFNYWRADGLTPATDNSDVAFIDFELVLTHAGNGYRQRSRIALRN